MCVSILRSAASSRRAGGTVRILGLGLVVALTLPALGAAQDLCEGYPAEHRIAQFGKEVPPMMQITGLKEMSAALAEHKEGIVQVLDAKKLDNLKAALFSTLETKSGWTLRYGWVSTGDTFDWLVTWKSGEPVVVDNVCLSNEDRTGETPVLLFDVVAERKKSCDVTERTTYSLVFNQAWPTLALAGTQMETEKLAPVLPPVCRLKAERSCGAESTLAVDASGSSIDVRVYVGDDLVVPSTPRRSSWGVDVPTWDGADKNPKEAVTVRAVAQNRDNCGNLQKCEETVTLEPCAQ